LLEYSVMNRTIKLIKNRSDIGAGTRGADLGIDAIEIAAINCGNDYFNRFVYEDVETHNDSIYNKVNNTFAARIEDVYEQCSRVCEVVCRSLKTQHFPIVLSGDHSSALGTMSGIKAAFPEQQLGVIWIDAHADLHSPYTTPSGNIHGMPLAAALAEDNLACQINELTPTTANHWTALKNIGIEGPKVLPDHVVYFGVRDTENAENQQIAALGIKNYTVAEIRYRGLTLCISEALQQLQNCALIYISFDVDSLDCDMVSHGTGTPVSKGFDPQEVIDIINHIIQSRKVICLEVVEVNPLLDLKGNKMAETAFDILNKVTQFLG
jgi:arginase